MKIIGEPIFTKLPDGRLASRTGTLFLKTPGLVTRRGPHAMQRGLWIDELNAVRAQDGLPPLTTKEEEAELAESVDLSFVDDRVLIRPDPERLDLAFKADEVLQAFVSKRRIRFLNSHLAKVRNALRARGENWRMARKPISPEDMVWLIENSKVISSSGESIFYYNTYTGTRYVTIGGNAQIEHLTAAFRAQVKEAQAMLKRRNRLGFPELDFFPRSLPIELKQQFKDVPIDELTDAELKAEMRRLDREWRMALPPELRDESVDNIAWRNAMCDTLTQGPEDDGVDTDQLVQGLSPEFYRQIEWMPGARVEDGKLIFDSLWDEYIQTKRMANRDLLDPRVWHIVFNLSRMFGDLEYVNVGRIVSSMSKNPAQQKHSRIYIVQCKQAMSAAPRVYILRFLKWGVAEHLDEGKNLLSAMLEANEYLDYILDRRLMCQQLGMKLQPRINVGRIAELYQGQPEYDGMRIASYYYVRNYIDGISSDKIPAVKFHNPMFAQSFAHMMGEAAAIDLIVGRRATETKENLFDKKYEVFQFSPDGLPLRLVVIDHAGSFVNYQHSLEESVAPYANVVRRRVDFVTDIKKFSEVYVNAFTKKLISVQQKYRTHRKAFDGLFAQRMVDEGGSGAFRWAKILERLDACDPQQVSQCLVRAIHA